MAEDAQSTDKRVDARLEILSIHFLFAGVWSILRSAQRSQLKGVDAAKKLFLATALKTVAGLER